MKYNTGGYDMEIKIIAPGVDCIINKVNIGTKIACDIIEEIYYNFPCDTMSIYNEDGDCIANIMIIPEQGLVIFYQHGRYTSCCLSNAKDAISNLIFDYFLSE